MCSQYGSHKQKSFYNGFINKYIHSRQTRETMMTISK